MRGWLTSLLLSFSLWTGAALAQAQVLTQTDEANTSEVGAPSANDLHEFTRLLTDPRIQGWIADQAADAQTEANAESAGLREELMAGVARTRARLSELAQAWRVAPQVPGVFAERWREAMSPAQQVRGLTFVMIFLFVGAGLEWLYRQYTNPLKLRIELSSVETIRGRLAAGASRALITIGGLVIFALGSIGTFAAFSWPPALETLVLNLLVVVFAVRALRTLLVLFLAPRVQELRLLPFDNRMARHLTLTFTVLAGVYILAASLSDIYIRLTGGVEGNLHALDATIALATLALIATYVAILRTSARIATWQE